MSDEALIDSIAERPELVRARMPGLSWLRRFFGGHSELPAGRKWVRRAGRSGEVSPEALTRARDMGFDTDTIYQHTTPAGNRQSIEQDGFNPDAESIWFPGERLGGSYFYPADAPDAASMARDETFKKGVTFPVFLKKEKFLDATTEEGLAEAKRLGVINVDRVRGVENVAEKLKSAGYDGMIMPKLFGKEPEVFVVNPSAIRSIDADFDPAKADSPMIYAGMPNPFNIMQMIG